jgi:hypothetical protein
MRSGPVPHGRLGCTPDRRDAVVARGSASRSSEGRRVGSIGRVNGSSLRRYQLAVQSDHEPACGGGIRPVLATDPGKPVPIPVPSFATVASTEDTAASRSAEVAHIAGSSRAERRGSRTHPPTGYAGFPVLKCGRGRDGLSCRVPRCSLWSVIALSFVPTCHAALVLAANEFVCNGVSSWRVDHTYHSTR